MSTIPDSALDMEHELRLRFASALNGAMQEKGMSIRQVGRLVGTSASQIQRLLRPKKGSSVGLYTMLRVAEYMQMDFWISLQRKPAEECAAEQDVDGLATST